MPEVTGATRLVALLGKPVSGSLSPRMQNAAFAARGLDWHYVAFDVEDAVAAVRALQTLGFAGANVTIPHKQAVVAACDEAEGEAVNTLVFSDGRVLGFNTDREILAGIRAERACVIGAGGAAAAHPAKVNYLFYARKPDHKHHFFTASDAEFQQFLATHGYG